MRAARRPHATPTRRLDGSPRWRILGVVTAEAKKILQDALTLPDQERLMVAEELFNSVDDATHAEVDDALRVEILRRVQQVRNHEVELVSWETVREHGREALAKLRRR